jgi:hypothetical protein
LKDSWLRPLSAEEQTVQSMPHRSPTEWHRVQTSWFLEELLLAPARFAPQVVRLLEMETDDAEHAPPQPHILSAAGYHGSRRLKMQRGRT